MPYVRTQRDDELAALRLAIRRGEISRPKPKLSSFAKAALFGKYTSLEIVNERIEICRECDNFKPFDETKIEGACIRCGCKVSKEEKSIRNLAAYEENLPEWGCKHKQRSLGKGWKR
jgi:hypothetical protein